MRRFLDAVAIYCETVRQLMRGLNETAPRSLGFQRRRAYLSAYIDSDVFATLTRETEAIKSVLGSVRYSVLIHGRSVTVRNYDGETDYGAEIEKTFAKFREGSPRDYDFKFADFVEMNHIEARILDLATKSYPEVFAELDDYLRDAANGA